MKQPFGIWKSLPPNRKLYLVVGTMAVLIACELFVLTAAMDKISSVRAFVEGEALWSKAQKNALIALNRFQSTRDDRFYREFLEDLKVPAGDHRARLELMNPHPNLAIVRDGFLEGRIDPADVNGVIGLLRNYSWISYVSAAIVDWTKGDQLLQQLRTRASLLHTAVLSGNQKKSLLLRDQIYALNSKLTPLEDRFSSELSEGSRWLQFRVMTILLCMVILVETTGLSLTVLTGREIASVADENARLYREAAESVKTRDEFISIASHELRTPLTALTLQLSALVETASRPGVERQVERVKNLSERSLRSVDRISGLVEDLLDMTKIQLGRLQIVKERGDLTSTVQEAVNQLAAEAKNHGSTIEMNSPGPITAVFDRRRMFQVALNLVSNAIKYGQGKPISVRLEQLPGKARFSVQDQGKGIPPEQLPKIFERYERLESDADIPGLGLGLYISNELVKSHGGTLRAESVLGQGSTFTVELPIEEG